ncbi:amidase [Bordetella sp. 02P26C-1]|nr:amidase [Bordetella sp. 02P26C-1]
MYVQPVLRCFSLLTSLEANFMVQVNIPTTSEAAVKQCIENIERWNPHINAIVTLDAETALEAARRADALTQSGRASGLLHGVPILVKDNIDTAGLRTTYASGFFKDHVPDRDATVVRRLREAGAIILGKVTLHEFAFGVRSNNPVIGQCRNPWNPARIPGGSSGGSGAAIAAGMAPLALGTDTGGSVRVPASLNGVCGLRPTVGRVSNHGCMPVSATHDTIGPLARTVPELARLFSVMAGFDPHDHVSERQEVGNLLVDMHAGIKGLRIGIPSNHYFDGVDSEVAYAVQEAMRVLESLGAIMVPITVDGAQTAHAYATTMIYSDACAVHEERLAQPDERWLPATLERMQMGLQYTGRDYARALRAREAWCRSLEDVFSSVDVILSPTSPTVAPPIEDGRSLFEATRAVTQNTYAGAFGKLPGLSVPCGFSSDGMPIGLMLEAAPWREATLFRAGVAYQNQTDWHLRQPALPA